MRHLVVNLYIKQTIFSFLYRNNRDGVDEVGQIAYMALSETDFRYEVDELIANTRRLRVTRETWMESQVPSFKLPFTDCWIVEFLDGVYKISDIFA